MSNFVLPAVFNHKPSYNEIKAMEGIEMPWIAVKVARNIYIRCRLAEAQNWKCCWCGEPCRPEANHPDSATIEHVQPRSFGGADDWENYAMACATCNHKRGTLSVEDFMAGKIPAPSRKESNTVRRRRKQVEKYVKKAMERNETGWTRRDGSPLCKREWFDSLRIGQQNHRNQLLEVLGLELESA